MEILRFKRIAGLALPIIAGMVSQNVFNLVDTAMVGSLGNEALAAVGLGGFATFMVQAPILGVSVAVQVMAARRVGEGRAGVSAIPLNTGIIWVWVAGGILSAAAFFLVPGLYPLLNSDPGVILMGVPYLQIRILATVFAGTNFAFRGYWNAVERSRLYMSTLIVMHVANIVLNYILIFGHFGAPALGVTGAGIASALATALGTAVYFTLGLRHARRNGFLRGICSPAEVRILMGLTLPSGVQQFFFAAGYTVLYWIIGRVGTSELAAANVLINVMLVAILPGMGLGLSAATLVSQALGRRDPADAARWAWDVVKLAVVGLAVLGIPMWLAPDLVLSPFVHDPATREVARLPMQLVGVLIGFDAVGLVLMHALLGAGDVRRVMMVSIGLQWMIFLPLAYVAGSVLGLGLLTIWALQAVYRIVQSGVFMMLWKGRRWAAIRV